MSKVLATVRQRVLYEARKIWVSLTAWATLN
jgi:hypothetical protein